MKNAKLIVYKNIFVTLFAQIIKLLLRFALQKVFICTLGAAYLGYNSVFANILEMLNMADLGVGIAITSFLYKPLADHNYDRVNALMYMYKRIYHFIGLGVAIIGVFITFLLPIVIPDAECSNLYLRFLFIINLVGTVSTYFLAYKRTLVIAKQKSYYTNSVDLLTNIVGTILQIIFLFVTPNYIIYSFINIGKNIGSNIIIGISCDKENGRLSNEIDRELVREYRQPIVQYVKDVFISKIGAYIYHSTDNIIISMFKGSLSAGYLSNYTLITTGVYAVLNQLLASIQATYGNFVASNDDREKQYEMTSNYMFVNFIMGNTCLLCCLLLFQPFMRIYLGTEYLLEYSTVILLSVNVFLTIILVIPSQIFIIYKLYQYDKYIILFSAVFNIVLSAVLVNYIGLNGVLIGTLVTSLIYLFSRLYIIASKIFKVSNWEYLKKIFIYLCITIITLCITSISIKGIYVNSWISLICEGIMVGITCLLTALLLSYRMKEAKYLLFKLLPFRKRMYILMGSVFMVFIGMMQIYLRYDPGFMSKSIIKLPDAMYSEPGDGFTCTGLACDGEFFYIGNVGKKFPPTEYGRASIVVASFDFSTIINEIEIGSMFPEMKDVQGITIDKSDETIWFCSFAENKIRHIDLNGNDLGYIKMEKPTGIAYDSRKDVLWVLSYTDLACIDKSGHLISSIPIIKDGQDQIYLDEGSNCIYLTAGKNYQGKSYVYVIELTQGAIIRKYTLADSHAIEGICLIGNNMIILNDGLYHNAKVASNQVNIYDLGEIQ